MTNFFLEELRKIYGDGRVIHDPQFVGECCYEEGLSGMETEYAQYAEAKAVLDACGFSRQTLTEEKADIYEQLAQINKQIRAERQKIKLCREIAEATAKMQQDIERSDEKTTPERQHTYFRN